MDILKKFLFLDSFITPKIVTFIFWAQAVLAVLGGLFSIFSGSVIGGLLIIVIGPVLARVSAEMVIVLFKIHDNLQKIADREK